ncbi:transposase [Tamaricihabitans halophyticus]|uniref:transposase n=1 Tax=Tamaricihabitans halophyticus TaxID=1262583 RepID=UPI001FB2C870|nr:transposase [Tamaricihabitans halophyticus]
MGHPARQRATYNRHGGVRHLFGGLDLASGQVFYRIRDHKRWQEFLDFLRQLRRRFPHGRLYVICDNFGPHKKAEVRAWCATHDVELVYTPHERILAELDRVRIHCAALLRPRRHRPPQPHRAKPRPR